MLIASCGMSGECKWSVVSVRALTHHPPLTTHT